MKYRFNIYITIPHAAYPPISDFRQNVMKWKMNNEISGPTLYPDLLVVLIQDKRYLYLVTDVDNRDLVEYVKTLYRDCVVKYEEKF